MTSSPRLEQMDRSTTHALTPRPDCRDRGRQGFVYHLKRGLGRIAMSDLQDFVRRRSGTPSPDAAATAACLESSSGFAAWSALNKGSQRRMWLALDDMVSRQADALQATAAEIAGRKSRGSLDLDTGADLPAYLNDVAFHGQPGGYVGAAGDDDIRAGLLQEAGGTLYTRGAGTGRYDSKAQAVVRYLGERFPGLQPRRVLDLGCGHGAQTCAYALAWPDADVHGIDLGTAQLRYAHLRAEALDIALHFHRRSATDTGFDDRSFDLVISNILLHEVPTAVMQQIMAECHRLLAPGGVVIHQDVPTQKADMPGYQKYLAMWQTRHNDEPFWQEFADSSVPDALAAAGFDRERIVESYVPQLDGPLSWYFVGATR